MALIKGHKKWPVRGPYPEKEFHALIEHERRRSDRTGARFSIIVFDISDSDTDMKRVDNLPSLLVDSVRSTDAVGLFGKNQVGVLLTDTPVEGAYEFIKKISKRLEGKSHISHHKVYSYPSQRWPDSDCG
jgi:hypothetical protein